MPVSCAALIFPALEDAAAKLTRNDGKPTENTIAANIKTKAREASASVADYFDRRAHRAGCEFLIPGTICHLMMRRQSDGRPSRAQTPSSRRGRARSAPEFRPRFADPTRHSNKHLFSLITGGKWKTEPYSASGRRRRSARPSGAHRGSRSNPASGSCRRRCCT